MDEVVVSEWSDSSGRKYRDVMRDGKRVAQVAYYPGSPSERWVDWEEHARAIV